MADDVFELPVSGIPAQLKIKGSSQTFEFDDLASVQAIFKNKFVPTLVANTQERLGWYNSNDCGFLYDHITTSTDTRGTFKLRSKVNDTYTDIFTVSNSNVLTFNTSVGFDGLNLPKLGIGIDPTVNGRIQFAATQMVNKLSLYNAGVDDYNQSGFGANSLGTLYHAPGFTSHTFYLGNSTTIPLRADALGITIAELRPINADFRRIMFYDEGENVHQVYNIGIKDLGGSNYAIHNQVSKLNAAFTWGAALNSSSSADVMSLRGDTSTQKINLKLMNPLAASVGVPAYTQLDLVNSTSGSVRFLHTSSSTDILGLGSLKVQLVNSSGITSDAFTVADSVFGAQTTFNGAAFFDAGITTQNNSLFLMTANFATWQAITLTNAHASGNTFIRFNNAGPRLNIGSDKANSQSYIDSTDPFVIKIGGTIKFYMDSATGNVGIGTTTPHAPLQFQNLAVNRKIVLYEEANNDHQYYGFGINNGILRYQVSTTTADHVYYAGLGVSSSVEVGRITGTGNFISPGTILGKTPRAYVYMSGNATGAASVAATWVKIAGTTTSGATSNLFDMPVTNRVRYTGTTTLANANVTVCLTFTYASSISTRLGFSVFKNGSLITESPKYVTNTATNLSMFVGLGVSTTFSTNDYIEVFFLSPNGGVTLIGTDLSIIIG